jgi:hypothetical protein
MYGPAMLYSLSDALSLGTADTLKLHKTHLNPRLASLCELIGAASPLQKAKGWRSLRRRL